MYSAAPDDPVEPIRFTMTLEPAESRRFATHTLSRAPLSSWLACGATAVLVAAVLATRDLTDRDYTHGVFELALACIVCVYLVRLVRGTYARALKRGEQTMTYGFSEAGVACEGPNSSWWLPWRSVGGYVRRPDGYYFAFGSSYVPVPLRAIPLERATAFVSLVNRRATRYLRNVP